MDAVSTSHDPLAQHCHHVGILHVAIGTVIGGLVAWDGLLVLLDAMTANHRAGTPPSRRRLVVLSMRAVALVLVVVTVAGTATYESGSRTPTQAVGNDGGSGLRAPGVPG